MAAGGYGFEKSQIKTGGETERLNYLVSLSDQQIDGYRAQSAYENKLLTGRFGLDLGKDRNLLTVVNFTDQPVSDDPGGLTAAVAPVDPRSAAPLNVQFDAGESLEQTRLGFVYTAPAGERGTISARNYYAWRDFGNLLPTLNQGIVDLERQFIGGGFSYSYDGFWLDRPNRFIAGVDFDDQDDDRRRYNNLNGVQGPLGFNQNEHVTSQGLFLQNELSVSERVQLSFGVRFDQVEFEITDHYFADGRDDSGSKQFDDTSPMVGLVVELTDDLNFYTTYSSAFETPTTTEFNRQDGLGGFNEALEPQTATNFEVGLRGALGDAQRYEVAVFTIDVEDELVGREIPTSPGRNYFENAGETSREGVEFSWTANFTDRIETTVSYTYSDFKFAQFVETVGAAQHRSQRQRDPRRGREPAVRRVRLSRPARLVRCGRGAVRRRAIRRQRQQRRHRRLHADELPLRLRRGARQRRRLQPVAVRRHQQRDRRSLYGERPAQCRGRPLLRAGPGT